MCTVANSKALHFLLLQTRLRNSFQMEGLKFGFGILRITLEKKGAQTQCEEYPHSKGRACPNLGTRSETVPSESERKSVDVYSHTPAPHAHAPALSFSLQPTLRWK